MAKQRIHEIADALALHLGGAHVPAGRDGEYFEQFARVVVPMPAPSLPYELSLSRKGYGADEGKITVRLGASDYPGERIFDRIHWPSARIDEKRDLQSIVADVARHVCNVPEAATALRKHAKLIEERDARKAGVDGAMAEILASSRATESHNYPRTAHEGHIFSTGGGVYFGARVGASGVHFDRIGTVTVDQAKRIIAILEEVRSNG